MAHNRKASARAMILFVFWLGLTGDVRAGQVYAFTTLDYPGLTPTPTDENTALGINDSGQIVGVYTSGGHSYGYLYSGSTFTPINVPGATDTRPFGINNSGQIVGDTSGSAGFMLSGGTYSTFQYPGSSTEAFRINNAGQIVGLYNDGVRGHAYLLSGGTYTSFDVPGSSFTSATGINNHGQIVGITTIGGTTSGYLLSGGVYTILFPGGGTSGINDSGVIVGMSDSVNGYVYSGGTSQTLDFPGALVTKPGDINDAGEIVGSYRDANGIEHGFIAVPVPEPSSLVLLAIGIGGMAGYGWRRRKQPL